LGLLVRSDAAAALAEWQPDVVLHTTLSFLNRIEEQLATIIRARAHVVSSTEELFYPFERDPAFARRIDNLAREHGVAVVGTGVNPGFVMDVLPLCLTGVCASVQKIIVTRVVDASQRRLPLQKKIGAGISRQAFEERVASGTFGHIGLRESALAVMATFGWSIEKVEESLEPVIADRRIETSYLVVEAGQVAGLHQTLRVHSVGVERLVLDLQMAVGVNGSYDAIEINGNPPLSTRIEGGIFGDTATVAALVNTIPKILHAPPGLRTMMELPLPYAYLGTA
ncbi:MAG: NAD(P)H-dependent amine dehydrogenase family protein, partial [Ardenticatenaceae bacterium]